MLGRRFIRGAWRLSRTHRGHDLPGKIEVYILYTKQKINVKSSKEDALIGVDENMSKIQWSRYLR